MPVRGLAVTLSSVSAVSSAGTGIRAVSFEVEAGSVHGVLGENLSGASEVLAVVGGYLPVAEGVLAIDGEPRQFAGHRAAERIGVRVIRGEPAVVPHSSVAENIYLGHEKAVGGFIRFGRLNANTAELLTRFGLGSSVSPSARASELTRGERWIVELLRSIVAERTVVLIDEPFTGMDAQGLDLVASGIRRLSAEGVTVIVATHRLDLLRKVAATVTVLSRGVAVETLALSERQPSEARLIEHMTANIRVTPRPSHETIDPGPVAFELTDWSAYHPVNHSLAVVQGISLYARRAEIVGLAGLEGSGLDEFALSLFGRTFGSLVTGEMRVNGHPLAAKSPQESVAGGVGLSTAADVTYDLNLLGGIPSRISSSMLARLARLGLVDRDRDYRTASPAFGLGGISALAGGRAAGARRASADGQAAASGRPVAFARGVDAIDPTTWAPGPRRHLDAMTLWLDLPLERRPVVVVLDHPTAGLTGEPLHVMRDLIVELATGGTAVLLASDDLDELLVMTNRIYTLAGGRITAETATRAATPQSLLASMLGPA